MIAIRNMKMPNNCAHCDFCMDNWECLFLRKLTNNIIGDHAKLPDCPLVDIDECQESDCISKQALYNELYTRFHEDDAPGNITYLPLGRVRDFVKNFPPLGLTSDKESAEKEKEGVKICQKIE